MGYAEAQQRLKHLPRMVSAQWHTCPICGCHLEFNRSEMGPWFVTFDHVIPKSKGGPDRPGNLLAVHKSCNEEKGDKIPKACQLIWLLAVNSRLGFKPDTF